MRAEHLKLVVESIIVENGPECEVQILNKDGKPSEISFQQQFDVDRHIIGETRVKRAGVIIIPEWADR